MLTHQNKCPPCCSLTKTPAHIPPSLDGSAGPGAGSWVPTTSLQRMQAALCWSGPQSKNRWTVWLLEIEIILKGNVHSSSSLLEDLFKSCDRRGLYQSEEVEHCQVVVWATGMAAVQLVQAIGQDSLHERTTGLHTGQQHSDTLVPCCQNGLWELDLLGRGHTRQNSVQNLEKTEESTWFKLNWRTSISSVSSNHTLPDF